MKEKRSTTRFHITMNFWNIMSDTDSKSFQEEKDDPNTKDLDPEWHRTIQR